MIEINLVPDVKQELIRAQRARSSVISIAIFASIIALGILVVLLAYIYGVQGVRNSLADSSIKSQGETLAKVDDLSKTLTIQNQLTKLSAMHNEKLITSRFFDVLDIINPSAPNNMTISSARLTTDTNMISIEGFAANGYSALEMFKKTIEASSLEYVDKGGPVKVGLTDRVDIVETSYGESSDGSRVLRFTISFEYPDIIFARGLASANVVSPVRENATDSYRGLPKSLFGDQADDVKEGN